MPSIGECLLYPLSDGPGLGLLVLFPPAFWVLSLPIFDFIAYLQPLTKGHWAPGLAILPIFLPLMFSFAMTFGYVLLFLGYVLVASAMGENDHPRWPEWHPAEISEGIIRWVWALLLGVARADCRWHCTGATVVRSTGCMASSSSISSWWGRRLVRWPWRWRSCTTRSSPPIRSPCGSRSCGGTGLRVPCLVASVALVLGGLGVYGLLFRMPRMWMEAVALWAFWVFVLYEGMVVMRMLGLTYHAHAVELVWFRRRPRWATSRLHGRIYSNS